jgi:hypothetical protein
MSERETESITMAIASYVFKQKKNASISKTKHITLMYSSRTVFLMTKTLPEKWHQQPGNQNLNQSRYGQNGKVNPSNKHKT